MTTARSSIPTTGRRSPKGAIKRAARACAGALAILLSSLVPAPADSTSPRLLLDPEAQAEWQAVGRINVAGRSFCTGTLVAPDLVVTVAHCLFNARTGSLAPSSEIHFLAGYRMGAYAAHRTVSETAVHPGFRPSDPETAIFSDLAVLRLAEPITDVTPVPTTTADRAIAGQRVFTLSYGMDRPEALSIERDCHIAEASDVHLVTSCEATPGVSGSPLLTGVGGEARMIGIIVAMAGRVRAEAIAIPLGADFRALLADRVK